MVQDCTSNYEYSTTKSDERNYFNNLVQVQASI